MRFSFNWLKNHLITDLNINDVCEKMTAIGLEVEKTVDPDEIFKNFKLVEIKHLEKHPNADKLQICQVADSCGNNFNIVCGAKNVKIGLKTIMALPNAIIPATNSVLKKGKIRGVESEGMLCSAEELGLDSEIKIDEIIELNPDINIAISPGEALEYNGGVIDVSLTPNRGDCFSVKGIARDLAATNIGKFIEKKIEKLQINEQKNINIQYSNQSSFYAPFIAFRVIRGIKNAESPNWLKNKLKFAGLNSISLVVDLANWYMIDSGRPLHIYDLNKINGDLFIRFADKKEKFVDIKGNIHELKEDMLVAADKNNVLCLLGITGGKATACSNDTTDILIESGVFSPIFISKTATFLNISTDSRTRFERGIDTDFTEKGLEEFSKIISDNCGGKIGAIKTVGVNINEKKHILLRRKKLNNILGYEINWNKAKIILQTLGIQEIKSDDEEAIFVSPTWRADIKIEEDLVEEILRINGFENINVKKIEKTKIILDKNLQKEVALFEIGRLLASVGLSENISYSFIKQNIAEAFKEDKKLIYLMNPINSDMGVMRPSLLPGLLTTALRTLNFGESRVNLFEIGNIYYDECSQKRHITGIRTGNSNSRNWLEKTRDVDVFDAKTDILAILANLEIDEKNIVIEQIAPSYFHPARSGSIFYGKKKIGVFGELHPKIGKLLNISTPNSCFEIFADELLDIKIKKTIYNERVFPKITRDFAFLFEQKKYIGNIINKIYKIDQKIIYADVFDCFEIKNDKKSIGITILLGDKEKTLTEYEAKSISDKVIELVEQLGGELRQK